MMRRLVPSRWIPRGLRLAGWLLGLACGAGWLAAAQSDGLDQNRLRSVVAAYLVKIANHVTWPAVEGGGTAPLTIGIMGPDPLGGVLDELLVGKTAGGRPLRAVRVQAIAGLADCQMVFLHRPSAALAREVAEVVADRPVLVVAYESEEGSSPVGVDLMLTKDTTIRYKLSTAALKRAGLVPSTGLLQFALPESARPIRPPPPRR